MVQTKASSRDHSPNSHATSNLLQIKKHNMKAKETNKITNVPEVDPETPF
jgi:hypothetical protein